MNGSALSDTCICCSGKPTEKCCDRFLEQGLSAKTPEQLMRSRYTAYARGGCGAYLLRTWFPVTAPQVSEVELSQRSQQWTGLELLSKSQQGDDGMVEFKAYHLSPEGKAGVLHEKSVFKRIGKQWLYVGGEVHSETP